MAEWWSEGSASLEGTNSFVQAIESAVSNPSKLTARDYRYTWMRDAAFTVYAFLRIGFRDEAAAFMGWIEDYASQHVNRKRPAQSSSPSRATHTFPSRR